MLLCSITVESDQHHLATVFSRLAGCSSYLTNTLICTVQINNGCEMVIENNGQLQQLINVECISEFSDAPILQVQLILSGNMHNFNLKLPVMLSKFAESTSMDSGTFFQRWKQLNQSVSLLPFIATLFCVNTCLLIIICLFVEINRSVRRYSKQQKQ